MASGFAFVWFLALPLFILLSSKRRRLCASCLNDIDKNDLRGKLDTISSAKIKLRRVDSHNGRDTRKSRRLQEILNHVGHPAKKKRRAKLKRANAKNLEKEKQMMVERNVLLAEFGIYSEELLLIVCRLWQMDLLMAADLRPLKTPQLVSKMISRLHGLTVHRKDSIHKFGGVDELTLYFKKMTTLPKEDSDVKFDSVRPVAIRLVLSEEAEDMYFMRVYNLELHDGITASVDLEEDIKKYKEEDCKAREAHKDTWAHLGIGKLTKGLTKGLVSLNTGLATGTKLAAGVTDSLGATSPHG